MPSLAQQKQKLETEKAELERKLAEAEEREQAALREIEDMEARAENAEAELKAKTKKMVTHSAPAGNAPVHEQSQPEPQLLYDPFDSKNPHKIVKHPPGVRLGWKNPTYRENHRGWRGWIPVKYDSDIGRNLKSYLLDPPRKMAHQDDDMVRRGDAILCSLPEEMWQARQAERVSRANRQRSAHSQDLRADSASEPASGRDANSVGGRTMTS